MPPFATILQVRSLLVLKGGSAHTTPLTSLPSKLALFYIERTILNRTFTKRIIRVGPSKHRLDSPGLRSSLSFVETAVRWSFLSEIAEFIELGVGERYENVDDDLGKKNKNHQNICLILLCNLFEDDEKVTLSMSSKDFPESLGLDF